MNRTPKTILDTGTSGILGYGQEYVTEVVYHNLTHLIDSNGNFWEYSRFSHNANKIENSKEAYMNLATGSVGFESDWDNLDEVVKVRYDYE